MRKSGFQYGFFLIKFVSNQIHCTMKNILVPLLLISFVFLNIAASGQCTPGNAETCPDPENNGEVCPDSLAPGYLNVPYSQEITILPPEFYEFGGNVIELHSVKLLGLDNLPPGLGWVSNSPDSVFMAGQYYCVLIDGTPEDTGEYHLYINIEVFIEIAQNIISIGTIQDSSLSMFILPESAGLQEYQGNSFRVVEILPNPFDEFFEVNFTVPEAQTIWMHIYDLTGQVILHQQIQAEKGLNHHRFNGSGLPSGMFLCTLSDRTAKHSFKLVKR